jgi:hypothetical protein
VTQTGRPAQGPCRWQAICCRRAEQSKPSKECLLSEVPEGLRNQALRRYHYVTKISAARPLAKTADALQPLILSASLEINDPNPPSGITVYRWLKTYEKAMTPAA